MASLFWWAFVHSALAQSTVPDIDTLRQAVSENPANAEKRRQLGQAYFRERQSKLALDQYQEALRLEPLNENLYLEASAIFMAAGLAEQAEAVLLEAGKRFPNSKSPRYNLLYHELAELWTKSGRLRKARDAMETATLFTGPADAALSYKRLGDFNTDLLQFDEALSAYTRSLRHDPENSLTHLALGNLHLQRNSPTEALAEFDKAFALDSRNVEAFYGAAEAHRRMGRWTESVAAAEKLLQADPNHLGARYVRGTVLIRLGRTDDGHRELEAYRKLQVEAEAQNRRLREIQTFKTTGMFHFIQGQYGQAIAVFREAISAHPGIAELYFNLGMAQSQAGHHHESIATFLDLLGRRLGTDTLVHRYLAQEYLAVGDVKAAAHHQALYVEKREAEFGAKSAR